MTHSLTIGYNLGGEECNVQKIFASPSCLISCFPFLFNILVITCCCFLCNKTNELVKVFVRVTANVDNDTAHLQSKIRPQHNQGLLFRLMKCCLPRIYCALRVY